MVSHYLISGKLECDKYIDITLCVCIHIDMVRKMGKKRSSKRYPRRRVGMRARRAMLNPRPVFTETYKAATWTPNAGYLLQATMDGVGQTPLYQQLYAKYRILRAHWIIVPQFNSADQNAYVYNTASGPTVPPGLFATGITRLVYAINNSPGLVVPASEQQLLEDNGCVIKTLDKVCRITNRPVPDTKDANGVQITYRGNFIDFKQDATPNVAHPGVSVWLTQLQNAGDSETQTKFDVYCKLTFQLSDAR